MEIEITGCPKGRKRNAWISLLTCSGLDADLQVEQTVLIWENGNLIAAGSRQGNLLKCIAVASDHQGENLTATLVTNLRRGAFEQGHKHLLLYTKPQNKTMFSSLFFYPIAQTEHVLLMEDRRNGICEFLNKMPVHRSGGKVGAAVVNCNPFTLGHRFLIETAAGECDWVYVFVLSEDKSFFSAKDRLEMVTLGTADLKNVTVLPTGPYLISSATFPTYFIKERDRAGQIQCLLDLEIFARYYVKRFGITHRYVGTEPLSPVTREYNDALRGYLPGCGVVLREIPRLEIGGNPVSASAVRQYVDSGEYGEAAELLPETTRRFLENSIYQ